MSEAPAKGAALDPQTLRRRADRERKARLAAEEIAERATRELYDRQRALELLETIAAAANSAREVRSVLQVTVDAVCDHTGWPVGHAFLLSRDGRSMLPTGVWHLDEGAGYKTFRRATEAITFKKGEGLIGRVLEQAAPVWIPDATTDPNFSRFEAAASNGLRAAFGFPVLIGDAVVGVVEFFSDAVIEPDERLLDLAGQVGVQLGRVMERERHGRETARRAEELRRYAEDLEYANDELKEFAYVASHDLSEPLRTISGFVQLLQKRYGGELDETADEFIGFVIDGTERMQALIDGLLSYSRAGRTDVVRAKVDLNESAAAALRSVEKSITDAGAEIEVGDLPTIAGDRAQLDRVFENLISNAVKFRAPERTPVVKVESALRDGAWRISVADNGIGIEERHRERIFNVFQRLHAAADYAGTGIGLSIVKKVVERHGGRLWVEGTPGGGSTFMVVLPAIEEGEPG